MLKVNKLSCTLYWLRYEVYKPLMFKLVIWYTNMNVDNYQICNLVIY